MRVYFLTDSGRPGFKIVPETPDDNAILKQLYDWEGQFPEDKFGFRSSGWSDGNCLYVNVGYQKPFPKAEPIKPNESDPDNNGPKQ